MAKAKRIEAEEMSPAEAEARLTLEAIYAGTFKNLTEGSLVEGTILAVQHDGVLVDVGYKSAGVIPREEFQPELLEKIVPGDRLVVYLEDQEDKNGNVILSKEKANRMQIWSEIEEIHTNQTHVDGKILSKIKGGLVVDIGVKAFLPGSQIDLKPIRDMDPLIGKSFPMKIITMDHRRGNIVVSRRAVLEETRDSRRKKVLSGLKEGQIIEGAVKNLTEYGAFVDLGGIDGLLHITDMSWGRVGHPSELFSIGDKATVVILKYDKNTGRISLGYKQQYPDPWDHVESKYAVGAQASGKVTSLTDYGAFVELEPGIEGLVHISDMSWSHEAKHPSKIVSVGDAVRVVVLNIDRRGRKIAMGMKQIEGNPWDNIEARYPVGSKVTGRVRNLTEFGAFIGLENGIDALVHISDLTSSRHIKHPSEILKKGQLIEAVVLKIDREKERIALDCKSIGNDQWSRDMAPKYPIGGHVKGKITKVTHFGLFVELEENVEALVHLSETDLQQGMQAGDVFKPGSEISAKVIRIDPAERKISLSMRALTKELEDDAMAHYQSKQGEADFSIGAGIKAAAETQNPPAAGE
jgi:small subunit ribosomal protein S1